MTTPHGRPDPSPAITPADRARLLAAACADHLTRLLSARRWGVACASVCLGQVVIASLNIYDDPMHALKAFDDLTAELAADPGAQAVLVPVGPVTEAEFVAVASTSP